MRFDLLLFYRPKRLDLRLFGGACEHKCSKQLEHPPISVHLEFLNYVYNNRNIVRKDKKLYQSCHILHKQGRYFIVHFKELFLLDGKKSNLEEADIGRRNTIATLMSDWGLVTIDNLDNLQPLAPLRQIKIISFRDKDAWELCPKYNIGRK